MANNYWFTSDHHFGHENIIEFQPRPFSSLEEMDEELVKRHNEVVHPNDVVWHLGDFTMRTRAGEVARMFKRLNGMFYVVPGNHDYWIKSLDLGNLAHKLAILPLIHKVRIDGLRFILCHYAMRRWDRREKGYRHLYGHSHGAIESSRYPGSMDVGVDCNNYYPFSLEQVRAATDSIDLTVQMAVNSGGALI